MTNTLLSLDSRDLPPRNAVYPLHQTQSKTGTRTGVASSTVPC